LTALAAEIVKPVWSSSGVMGLWWTRAVPVGTADHVE
jgi:hypothetical protein